MMEVSYYIEPSEEQLNRQKTIVQEENQSCCE